jgi:hypothetical protein
MNDSNRRPLFNFYIDDSGTRHPDKAPSTSAIGDWFSLGGVLIADEDEGKARDLYGDFCRKWSIDYPLHSVKIRHRSDSFSWLATLSQPELREFFGDLDDLMIALPVVAQACVINRPGYHGRYYEKYGRRRWHLCKTAFSVVSERVAKYAIRHDRRVRLFVEETDRASDRRIKSYFKEMRSEGMPFAKDNSLKYGPLSPDELRFRLVDLDFKTKSSAMIQLADLYLYPLCRSGYDQLYRPLKLLRENKKIIDLRLTDEEVPQLGVKYSCFD